MQVIYDLARLARVSSHMTLLFSTFCALQRVEDSNHLKLNVIHFRRPLPTAGGASEKRGQEGQEARRRTAIVFRPQARSVLPCHGVLALQHKPWTQAVQDKSQLQDAASCKLAVQNGRQRQALELVSSQFRK